MSQMANYTGFCVECSNEQPAKYMERTGFTNPPCKYCGGVVQILMNPTPERIAKFKARYTRKIPPQHRGE